MTEIQARVPCTADTRDELRARKRGNERYEDVLLRLLQDNDGD